MMTAYHPLPIDQIPADEYLSTEDILDLRRDLVDHIRIIDERTRSAVRDLVQVRAIDADALDLATTEIAREAELRMADRDRRTLVTLRRQLTRLEHGEAGSCDECGGEISFRRLRAQPTANRCIDCATELEQRRIY